MNLDQLIWKDRKRVMSYFLIGISLLLIFVLGGQQFTDFRDPKVFWPLFFESLFLLVTSFVFRFFYKIDATFLIFVLGVPVGIFFTQISLLVHISSLGSGIEALSMMNDLLMIFCLGAITSAVGYYLGGKNKVPNEKIPKITFFAFCLFFLSCALVTAHLARSATPDFVYTSLNYRDFVDVPSFLIVGLSLIVVACIASLQRGDFSSNLSSSMVFVFFIAVGLSTLAWYEVFVPFTQGDRSSVGPLLALAVLTITYAIVPYIFYLFWLLHVGKNISNQFGVANWHITEAYLFWFLICYGPAALVDLN